MPTPEALENLKIAEKRMRDANEEHLAFIELPDRKYSPEEAGRAGARSISAKRACANGERRMTPSSCPSCRMSTVYFASPVTLSRASTRGEAILSPSKRPGQASATARD